MREHNAIYCGELSAHHYFRDCFYCDSGMIPWLLVAELVSQHDAVAGLVRERKVRFPSSGEINFTLEGPQDAIARVCTQFEPLAEGVVIEWMDLDSTDWQLEVQPAEFEHGTRCNFQC